MARRYHLKKIRTLLIEGFTAEELRRFCYDTPIFRPVYDELAQSTGKAEIVDHLIEYADQKFLLEKLLALVKVRNPARYEKYQPYYDSIIVPDVQDNSDEAILTSNVGGLFDNRGIQIGEISFWGCVIRNVSIAVGVLLVSGLAIILFNDPNIKRLIFPNPTATSTATLTITPTASATRTPVVISSTPTGTFQPTQEPTITSTREPTKTPQPSIDTPIPTSITVIPTDAPSPTPNPTPTATPPDAVVIAPELNLRAGPSIIYDRVGLLQQGDVLDVQGRIASNEWIQVQSYFNPAIQGWIVSGPEYVTINVDLNTIPILTPLPPPPTPTPTP